MILRVVRLPAVGPIAHFRRKVRTGTRVDISSDVVRLLREQVGPDLTLIGVGGITTAADAQARLEAGADLLQGYTAFVYEGPLWPRRVNQPLSSKGWRR